MKSFWQRHKRNPTDAPAAEPPAQVPSDVPDIAAQLISAQAQLRRQDGELSAAHQRVRFLERETGDQRPVIEACRRDHQVLLNTQTQRISEMEDSINVLETRLQSVLDELQRELNVRQLIEERLVTETARFRQEISALERQHTHERDGLRTEITRREGEQARLQASLESLQRQRALDHGRPGQANASPPPQELPAGLPVELPGSAAPAARRNVSDTTGAARGGVLNRLLSAQTAGPANGSAANSNDENAALTAERRRRAELEERLDRTVQQLRRSDAHKSRLEADTRQMAAQAERFEMEKASLQLALDESRAQVHELLEQIMEMGADEQAPPPVGRESVGSAGPPGGGRRNERSRSPRRVPGTFPTRSSSTSSSTANGPAQQGQQQAPPPPAQQQRQGQRGGGGGGGDGAVEVDAREVALERNRLRTELAAEKRKVTQLEAELTASEERAEYFQQRMAGQMNGIKSPFEGGS